MKTQPNRMILMSGLGRWLFGALVAAGCISGCLCQTCWAEGSQSPTTPKVSAPPALIVTSTADSGPGSLREMLALGAGGTIHFAVTGAVVLTSGELRIDGPVHLEGPGAHLLSIERALAAGTTEFRVFDVRGSGVIISDLAIRHGRIGESNDYTEGGGILNEGALVLRRCVVNDHTGVGEYTRGGGICNQHASTLVAEQCTFAGNTASGFYGEGGAIYNYGLLALTNCTFSSNSVGMWGGALHNDMLSDGVAIESCTFTRNSASFGSAIFNRGNPPFDVSPVFLRNTIVAGNAGTDIGHCSLIESGGYNLIGTLADPYNNMALPFVPGPGDRTNLMVVEIRLGPLQDNGGSTPTHALLRHSPALDTGPGSGFPITDQRGVTRPFGGQCDIGAFEADAVFINTPPLITCPGTVEWQVNYTNAATGTLTVTVSDNDGDDLQVVWTVDGTTWRTNVVPSHGTPTSASVSLMLTLATGTHVVSAAVSDAEAAPVSCATTVQVWAAPAMPPTIIRQPVNQTIFVGQTATLTVGAIGTPPLNYRWRHNGVTISGATNATLVLANVQSTYAGNYSVVVTNLYGAALSSNAVFTVVPGPVLPGSLDFTFDPSMGGQCLGLAQGNVGVNAIAIQLDGRAIIGGQFIGVDGLPQIRLARLNADGRLDPTFRPPALSQSYADMHLVLQSDGRVLVTDGVEVMRLNPDGSRDGQFQPQGVSNCWAVALQPDGKIVIGGGNYQSGFVDRLNPNGTRDSAFQRAGFAQSVRAIALQTDGRILVAGGPSSANSVARLNANGTLDTSFAASVTGEIYALSAAADAKIILAGTFRAVNNFERHGVARLNANGTLDTSFNPRLASVDRHVFVYALAAQTDGSVIIGGTSPHVYSNGWSWPGYWLLLKLNLDGSEDTDFTAELGDLIRVEGRSVRALAVRSDGWILAGCDLPNAGLVRISASGTPDASFRPSLQGQPGMVEALSRQPDGKVFVLGQFTSVTGTPRPRFARLNADGTLDHSFVPELPAGFLVGSYAVQSDGKVVVGAGQGQPMLADLFRLNPDGSRDFSFNPVVRRSNEVPYVLRLFALPDDRILVAGNFDSVNGVTRHHLARLHRDGTLDPTFDIGAGLMTQYDYAWVNALLLQPDGKILLGGWFEGVNGVLRRSLARLRGDGSVDLSFHASYLDEPYPVTGVASLALQPDGRVLVGMQRETFPESGPALARLNPDGSLDPTFHLGAGITAATDVGYVTALAIQPDGKFLVGGAFDTYDGKELPNLARLHPDGRVDLTFPTPWAVELEEVEPWEIGGVHAIELQPDGRILLGGWFQSIGGVERCGIARLNNDVVIPPAFVRREISRPTVRLIATPPDDLSVYAVEDRVIPSAVVVQISHGGVFDEHTGKVKFGPFYDHEARTLTYSVLIPPGCLHGVCGEFTFAGMASADGTNTPIVGDHSMIVAGLHPADLTPADGRLAIGEVTTYGAAWRQGSTWPVSPVPIPIDYVTRAAFLWRGGECYEVDPIVASAPLCWVNCDAVDLQPAALPVSVLPAMHRQLPAAFVPGESLSVTLTVTPGASRAFAVEEQIPAGWMVGSINDGGEWDAVNSRVKWGPFLDSSPRVLAYRLTPPAGPSGPVTLSGYASFDGVSVMVEEPRPLAPSCRIAARMDLQDAGPRLDLIGAKGAVFVIEASDDLATWTPLAVVTNTSGRVAFVDPAGIHLPQRFYRARPSQ